MVPLGRAVTFRIALGQAHDLPGAFPLLDRLPSVTAWVMADRGYLSSSLLEDTWSQRQPIASSLRCYVPALGVCVAQRRLMTIAGGRGCTATELARLISLSFGKARGDHAQRVVRGVEASSITERQLGKRAARRRVLMPSRTALIHSLPAAR